jgi:Reversibly glycosylated polypeptide
MPKSCHVVFTTINHPAILTELHQNISKYGHLEDVKVWVVGDRKTPASAGSLAEEVSRKGLETVYFDVSQQDEWGRRFPFYNTVPYNTDGRRVFGYLKALEEGCSILVSIDDDNFPTDDDFIGFHKKTGARWDGGLLREPERFHNICEYLSFEPQRLVYPRGFPFERRGQANKPECVARPAGVRIGVREGLWLREPDVDATTWLNGRIQAAAYNGPETFVLEQSTWSPVNTQNTSVVRELIPAFVFVIMGNAVPGGKLDRYGDIWGGYFLLALMMGTPYHVAFGRPLVEHRRNPHNYVDDLRFEFWGVVLTDWLLRTLRSDFAPRSDNILERILELAEFVESHAIANAPTWCPAEIKEFLRTTADRLRGWSAACRQIGI